MPVQKYFSCVIYLYFCDDILQLTEILLMEIIIKEIQVIADVATKIASSKFSSMIF